MCSQTEIAWAASPARRNMTELTPSESLATSDDDEVKVSIVV